MQQIDFLSVCGERLQYWSSKFAPTPRLNGGYSFPKFSAVDEHFNSLHGSLKILMM
jgi:hypothetical protein